VKDVQSTGGIPTTRYQNRGHVSIFSQYLPYRSSNTPPVSGLLGGYHRALGRQTRLAAGEYIRPSS
jgi:hypothetical protein